MSVWKSEVAVESDLDLAITLSSEEYRNTSPTGVLMEPYIQRTFVVRANKKREERKRGGTGAVRVREGYLREDGLLMTMSDTVLGASIPPSSLKPRYYVCPDANALHCYLDLFDEAEFASCFRGKGGHAGHCALLLLYSQLSQLTGAAGAMSIRQERRLVQLARSLPGTLIFFDKFCPEMHMAKQHHEANASPESKNSASSADPMGLMEMEGACWWCAERLSKEGTPLGRPQVMSQHDGNNSAKSRVGTTVVILSDDPRYAKRGLGAPGKIGGVGGSMDEGGNGLGVVKAVDCEGFVDLFCEGSGKGLGGVEREVGGTVQCKRSMLKKAYDLYVSYVSEPHSEVGHGSGQQDTSLAQGSGKSPAMLPHLSRDRLEAAVGSGDLLKGRLDVFEHNPREGVVVVGGAGLGGGMERVLKEWATSQGKVKVLVSGRGGMNRSIHGDMVAVELLPQHMWRPPADKRRLTFASIEDSFAREVGAEDEEGTGGGKGLPPPPGSMPTGRIVGVLEPGWRPYVVTIPSEEGLGLTGAKVAGGEESVMAVPMDPRVPKIRLRTRQLRQIVGQRIVVCLDGWPEGSFYPLGHYVSSLGPVGEVASEAAALLVECETRFDSFSFNALASLPLVPNPPKVIMDRFSSSEPGSAADLASSMSSSISTRTRMTATAADMEHPEHGFGQSPPWEDSGWKMMSTDLEGRRDLREMMAMSVDPPGCQDIDDAIHVRRLPNGNIEVGVHIADVTRFVPEGSALDREARVRSTTVYLVHRRIDMLPPLLSGDVCSLHQGRDRLAVSAMWEVEEDGYGGLRISKRKDGSQKCWFGRTVIHSVASMTYQQAESLVEQGRIIYPQGHKFPPPGQAGGDVRSSLQATLSEDLRLLTRLARSLAKERTANGAVDLSQKGAELKFKLNPDTGIPEAVSSKDESEIHHTIAELMILANSSVAAKILQSFPSSALLRTHTPPEESKIDNLQEVASLAGVPAMVGGSKKEGQEGLGRDTRGQRETDSHVLRVGLSEGRKKGLDSMRSRTSQERDEKGQQNSDLKSDLIKSMAVRAMSEAAYVSSGVLSEYHGKGSGGQGSGVDRFSHFGLGLEVYTHFTSPIRRYADIVVHRLLLTALEMPYKIPGKASLVSNIHRPSVAAVESEGDMPASMAPSILEMELHAIGEVEMKAAARRPVRAEAGDASVAVNPDGTRTVTKVSMLEGSLEGSRTQEVKVNNFEYCSKLSNPVSNAASQMTTMDPSLEGDSLLDELLGLDLRGTPNLGEEGGRDLLETMVLDAGDGGKVDEGEGEELVEQGRKEPFDGLELGKLCTHLNDRNRAVKRLSYKCQELFLRLYFKDHIEIVPGVVLRLRSNGFIAYVPAFDTRGPVFLADKDGNVQIDPAMLGIESNAGLPPTKGFAALPTCRLLPGARVSHRGGGGGSSGSSLQEEEILEVTGPPGSTRVVRLRALDSVMLQMSCEVLPSQARLPNVRFLLTASGDTPTNKTSEKLDVVHKSTIAAPPHTAGFDPATTASPAECQDVDMCRVRKDSTLYGIMQDAHQAAIQVPCELLAVAELTGGRATYSKEAGQVCAQGGGNTSTVHGTETPGGDARVALSRIALSRPSSKDNIKGGNIGCSRRTDPGKKRDGRLIGGKQTLLRKEFGIGRAIYGGYIPPRDAPSVSLFDFESAGGVGGDGQDVGGLSSGGGRLLASIGGTLASLDDGKVREYTQQAMLRSQRLGAEKRNTRISKSKSRN